jgi:hypothetical protein
MAILANWQASGGAITDPTSAGQPRDVVSGTHRSMWPLRRQLRVIHDWAGPASRAAMSLMPRKRNSIQSISRTATGHCGLVALPARSVYLGQQSPSYGPLARRPHEQDSRGGGHQWPAGPSRARAWRMTIGCVRFSSAPSSHKRCYSRIADATRTGSGSLPASKEHGRTFRRNVIANTQSASRYEL